MKRILSVILVIGLLFSLSACGKKAASSDWQEQYELGMRYLADGKYEEAILAFAAAIDIDPKQAEAFIGRAEAYLGLGETSENLNQALADYKEATSLDKNSYAAYLGLGGVQLALNDAKGAQESYQKAIKLDSSSASAHLGLADAYIAAGKPEKALDALTKAQDSIGENAEISDKIAELEASGVGGSAGEGGSASGEGSSSGEGGNGNGAGSGSGKAGNDGTDLNINLPKLEINLLSSSYNTDYIEDTQQYIPNAVMNWDHSFDVNGPSNVHYIFHAGYGIHTYPTETFQSIIDEAIWKENPEWLEHQAVPFNYYTSLLVMEDQLGKDIYCYYLGLDENMDPVAYTIIKDTVPN